MKLTISTIKLKDEKDHFLASVDWDFFDAGKVGTPGAVKYGVSHEDAYQQLKNG